MTSDYDRLFNDRGSCAAAMRAFVKRSADPEDIGMQEVPIPKIADDELLVRVRAFGVGVHDSYFLPSGISYPYPIGIEAAGRVEDVGSRVTAYGPGDRVAFVSAMQLKGGTWAEYAAVNKDSLIVRVPEHMTFEQAAAIPVAGNTALKAVRAVSLRSGDLVFLAGASGAIGTFAIQLAKARGWQVAASASRANHEYMRSLGADATVDYSDEDWPEQVRRWAPDGVDAAIAIQPGTSAASMRTVRGGGSLITVSGDRVEPQRGIRPAFLPQGADVHKDLTQLMNDVADGTCRLTIEGTYRFDDALEALRKTQTRHARGKLVVRVD